MSGEVSFDSICSKLKSLGSQKGFGIPTGLRRELFLPPENQWLKASRQWVQRQASVPDGDQSPFETSPALQDILRECASPDDEVARLHLDCAVIACAAARLLSAANGGARSGSPGLAMVQSAWDAMASAWHRPASEANSLEARDAQRTVLGQIQGWVSASAAPADVCGRVLSGAAEYFYGELGWPQRPEGRSWEYWHLLRSSWLGDLAGYLLDGQEQGWTTRTLLALVKDDHAIPAELEFESLSTGDGQVFIALEQAFMRLTRGAEAIFDDVPAAVESLLGDEPDRHDVRLCIQCIDHFGKSASPGGRGPLASEEITGPSATGAAGRGLYYAWSGGAPDRGIAVLAAMDKYGALTPVDLVERKAEAIAELPWVDTIAVVGEENRNQAERGLADKADDVTVVNLEDLECPLI